MRAESCFHVQPIGHDATTNGLQPARLDAKKQMKYGQSPKSERCTAATVGSDRVVRSHKSKCHSYIAPSCSSRLKGPICCRRRNIRRRCDVWHYGQSGSAFLPLADTQR